MQQHPPPWYIIPTRGAAGSTASRYREAAGRSRAYFSSQEPSRTAGLKVKVLEHPLSSKANSHRAFTLAPVRLMDQSSTDRVLVSTVRLNGTDAEYS